MIKKPRLPSGDDREGQSVRTLWLRTMRLKGRQSEWGWMSSVMLQAVSGASGNLRTDRSGDGGRLVRTDKARAAGGSSRT